MAPNSSDSDTAAEAVFIPESALADGDVAALDELATTPAQRANLAGLISEVRASESSFHWGEMGYTATQPLAGMGLTFSVLGPVVATREASFSLRTVSIGREEMGTAVAATEPFLGACADETRPSLDGSCVQRLEYGRDGHTEWWSSSSSQAQVGWELAENPGGTGFIEISMAVEGGTIEAGVDDTSVLIRTGDRTFSFAGLKAWDAAGRDLEAWIEFGQQSLRILVDDTGATWPISVDPVLTYWMWSAVGSDSTSLLGSSVAAAGDVNNDGYDDVIVGAPGYSNYVGRAYVYHGTSYGLDYSAATTMSGTGTYAYFGDDVNGAGDVNRDGYDDVIVGSYYYSSGIGRAEVHHGSSSGVSTTANWGINGTTNYYLGKSVAGAGDVNKDGYDDVIVGAYGYSSNAGRVGVYHGSSSGLSTTQSTNIYGSSSSYLGYSVDSAGDVNNDGYDDVIIGAFNYSSGYGRAYIHHGSSSGISSSASRTLTGTSSGENFGYCVRGVGSVNGDAYDDIAVGAPYYSSSAGRAVVYHGASTGIPSSPSGYLYGASSYQYFGYALGAAGDVNADGYGDLIVGSFGVNSYTGQAEVFSGSSSGVSTAESVIAGYTTNNYGGYSVSGAGDVNADGYDDVIVGNYYYSSGYGLALAYFGYVDADGDGYYLGGGYGDYDCNDADYYVNPGMSETVGDGIDQNCDGAESCYDDDDNDGYLDTSGDTRSSTTDVDCADAYEGTNTDLTTDCDDADSGDYPGATEITGNGDDETCDGKELCYDDDDNDGYLDTAGDTRTSTDADCADAYEGTNADFTTDCDDTSNTDNPAASEIVGNGDDENCDGSETCYDDDDNDGYLDNSGDTRTSTDADCGDAYEGTTTDLTTDCDDTDSGDYPGATEVTANGDDENCDGLETCYDDDDDDGYLDTAGDTRISADGDCGDAYEGASTDATTDCDDADGGDNPGAGEVVGNGDDENCDGTELCYSDVDNDFYASTTTRTSADKDCADSGEGTSDELAAGIDCNDNSAGINAGATELVGDEVDTNCDAGEICYTDVDNDGFAIATTRVSTDSDCTDASEATAATYALGLDCDDSASDRSPDLPEVCDAIGVDEDCDGLANDLDPDVSAASYLIWYLDRDGDGYGDAANQISRCSQPVGYVANASDCDDGAAGISPAAAEVTGTGGDEDCDGLAACYQDQDRDGYATDTVVYSPGADCTGIGEATAAEFAAGADCDDSDDTVHPGATEVCDPFEVDEDCDTLVDDQDSSTSSATKLAFYTDADADGYGDGAGVGEACDPPAGTASSGGDCADTDATVNPGSAEITGDQLDQNCDGAEWCFSDADSDGWAAEISVASNDLDCSDPGEATAAVYANGLDCDDSQFAANPAGVETCDAADIDEDCDGLSDDMDASPLGTSARYMDRDGDGYGDAITEVFTCDDFLGYILVSGDCDDENVDINPAATEVCDLRDIDDDCDSLVNLDDDSIDLTTAVTGYTDVDGDGYGTDESAQITCELAPEQVVLGADCNDADTAYYPGAPEAECTDLNDYNCDGSVGSTDADADGYVACEECDDSSASVNPRASEVCNEIDDDCDGITDGGTATDATVWYPDADGDGFGARGGVTDCVPPDGYIADGGDCADTNPDINPSAAEVCDGTDQDCDGETDEGACGTPDDTGDADTATADGDTGGGKQDGELAGPPEGCGCATDGAGGAAAGLIAVALAGLATRRRATIRL